MCSAALPFILLGDAFDCVTLDVCEKAFSYVEKNVALWTSPFLYSYGKNFLLRMCNDLLRRLSPSRNTVFCGRIQLFLARIFPLSEKSGLNLMSQFNVENVTTFAEEPDTDTERLVSVIEDDDNNAEEGETPPVIPHPIDFELYKQFWKLQDCFREPSRCYSPEHWKTLKMNTDKVLEVFASFKLGQTTSAPHVEIGSDSNGDEMSHCYFTKYLTSEKLLDLQIYDSKFRQHILVQFLILFQYLTGTVKFKGPAHVLNEEQHAWIRQMTENVYALLKDTPPDGQQFARTVEHVLTREENWIGWKNDGCKTFVKDKSVPPSAAVKSRRSRKRFYPPPGSSAKRVDLGSPELTRLWNLCLDNMEACCLQDRDFLPGMHAFFDEAIEQTDVDAMIEDEYKLVNNSSFVWRALRLLSRRGPTYFQASSSHQQHQTQEKEKGQSPTQGMKAMSHYVESVTAQLAKEKAQLVVPNICTTSTTVDSLSVNNLEMMESSL
ncbi:THO complex subunit 1-like isoform X2 [Corticium candelabrum]|uniref:THO complex subunit 1-like isoform X2 n=1 Tax=Corticium candelabrum TaxID=121492 RepID=UPI002E275A70|nr:THO complex subunit 1-like isoform X2 [Corticium candelabrum]